MRVFDTDNRSDVNELVKMSQKWMQDSDDTVYGYKPRLFRQRYGSCGAIDAGLIPIEDDEEGMGMLIPRDKLQSYHAAAKAASATPGTWDYRWNPKGSRMTQNGLNLCWSWAAVAALRTVRLVHGHKDVSLAPVSMGYLVEWRNRGNYLSSIVNGLLTRGVCPGGMNDHRLDKSVWDPFDGERMKYKLGKAWDLNPRDMERGVVSAVSWCRPILGAWAFWGHAVQLVDVRWINGKLETELNNSHNEEEHIFLKGSQALPTEAVVFVRPALQAEEAAVAQACFMDNWMKYVAAA